MILSNIHDSVTFDGLYHDCVLYLKSRVLKYGTTKRDGYRKCKSDPQVRCNCSTGHLWKENKDCIKTVTRHIWSEHAEMAEEARCTPICKRMYKARKVNTERALTHAKEQHGMSYTRYTGLAQVRN